MKGIKPKIRNVGLETTQKLLLQNYREKCIVEMLEIGSKETQSRNS